MGDETTVLPDESAFSIVTLPLPDSHWIYEPTGEPPMPMRRGTDDPLREDMAEAIRAATKYAVRASTMNGQEMDFDPDAMMQNMIVGLLGYWTPDGTSSLD